MAKMRTTPRKSVQKVVDSVSDTVKTVNLKPNRRDFAEMQTIARTLLDLVIASEYYGLKLYRSGLRAGNRKGYHQGRLAKIKDRDNESTEIFRSKDYV